MGRAVRGTEFAMMPVPPSPPPLEVYLLGLVDFEEVQQLQRRLVYELGERGGGRAGALRASADDQRRPVGEPGPHRAPMTTSCAAMGIKVHWVNRGGGCVLHLPGQLAAYFILPLEPLGPRPPSATSTGSTTRSLGVLDEFDLPGDLGPDVPGVFLGQAAGRHGRAWPSTAGSPITA